MLSPCQIMHTLETEQKRTHWAWNGDIPTEDDKPSSLSVGYEVSQAKGPFSCDPVGVKRLYVWDQ